MRKVSAYDLIGLPDSARHVVFVVALLLFLSPYLGGADLGVVKVPSLGKALANMAILGPVVLAAALLGYAKLWPSKAELQSSRPLPLAYAKRENLRFGLAVGWQLGRLEFVDGSSLPVALEAAPAIKAEISDLLRSDGFPKADEPLAYRDLMRSVLAHYSASDIEKHAAILVGMAAMRTGLIGASSADDLKQEISRLAFSTVLEADDALIPNKQHLFETLTEKPPKTIVDVIKIVEATCR